MQLTAIKVINGTITLKSGLHIGSGNMEMHIGGTDSPVIKHPHTLEPYIPGSSLKGKVRALLELESGLMPFTGGDVVKLSTLTVPAVKTNQDLKQKAINILKVFGASGGDKNEELQYGPTRVSFADAYLNPEWREEAKRNRWLLTEEKSENMINRIKGVAEHPRFIERVPAGTRFDFTVSFKILEKDDEELFKTVLLKGLKLLEMDTLGGCGSRGYGRIELSFKDENIKKIYENLNVFESKGTGK